MSPSLDWEGEMKHNTFSLAHLIISGQMQFRRLRQNGIHHLQDPEQIIFMRNQGKVVQAVLEGKVDVGYVRTDQLERTMDPNTGKLVDLSLVKIIDALPDLSIDDVPFPFQSSTRLYPEWNIAALSHVRDEVARKVQSSLLEMSEHAALAQPLLDCVESLSCEADTCFNQCFSYLDPALFQSCTTRPHIAVLAQKALADGRYAGWRTTLSYSELRTMQEDTGFISRREGALKCLRSTELADAVVCPENYWKRSSKGIEEGCASRGLPCYGFECLCKPCVPSFDVDFYPVAIENGTYGREESCLKLEQCATVEQRKKLVFQAVDNNQSNVTFTASIYVGSNSETYLFNPETRDGQIVNTLEIDTSSFLVGPYVVEVFAEDSPIPQSPFRFEVLARDCVFLTGDRLAAPDPFGNCICRQGAVQVNAICVPLAHILIGIFVPLSLISATVACLIYRYKRRQDDSLWCIEQSDIVFQDPPETLGCGQFGYVLSGDYRGTKVAVKVATETDYKETRRAVTSAILGKHCEEDTPRYLSSSNWILQSISPDSSLVSLMRAKVLKDEIRKLSKLR